MIVIQSRDELISILKNPILSDITSVVITISNEQKEFQDQFSKLIKQLPQIKSLIFYSFQNNIKSNFLKEIIGLVGQLKHLETLQLQFHEPNLSVKVCKLFIQEFQNRFYPNMLITLAQQDNQIIYKCNQTIISFAFDENASILVKSLSDKSLTIRIQSGQHQLYKLVQRNIQKQSQNLHIKVYLKDKLFFQCNNSSSNYDTLVNLILEDENDLRNFSIFNSFLVIIDLNLDEFNAFNIESNSVIHQLKKRMNVSWQNSSKKRIVLLSIIENTIITANTKLYFQKIVQQFDLTMMKEMQIFNDFQIMFYLDILQQKVLESRRDSPFKFRIYLNEYKENPYVCLANSKWSKDIQEIDMQLANRKYILAFLKSFFDICGRDYLKYLQLTLYTLNLQQDRRQEEIDYFDDIANLDTQFFIHKLKIIDKNRQYSYHSFRQARDLQFAIIAKIQGLQQISLSLNTQQCLIKFLVQNESYLSDKQLSKQLIIKFSTPCYSIYQVKQSDLIELQNTAYNFERITSFLIKEGNIAKNYCLEIKKFKRLVLLMYCNRKRYKLQSEYTYDDWLEEERYYTRYKSLEYLYDRVDHHDNPNCSSTRILQCTCNNNQIQQFIKPYHL